MEKLVSIIIPIYNAEKYLRQCLDSLIKQSYKNLEIICVNDASRDDSIKILKNYQKNDNRFVIIDKKTNEGASSARNSGLDQAHGYYVGFVDSDDWFEPSFIADLVNLFDENVAMTACGFKYQKRNFKHFKNIKFVNNTFDKNSSFSELISDKNLFGFVWNKMFKQEHIKNIRFDNKIHAGEDLVFCIKYLLNVPNNKIVKSTSKKLCHYIKTKGSQSGMKCTLTQFEKRKTLFSALEEIKLLKQLKNNLDFCTKVNSWEFLMALQFIMYARNLKLKEEKSNFKLLAKKYKNDYKKVYKSTFSSFRKLGLVIYFLINLLNL